MTKKTKKEVKKKTSTKKAAKKTVEPKKGRGRPSDYKPEYAEKAREYCVLNTGATNEDLAAYFGKNPDTIYSWKNKHPEFAEALRAGKTGADVTVANRLFDRAVGATWVEQQAFKLKEIEYDPSTGRKVREYERVEVVNVVRAAPPDTPAIGLWLKNRRPDLWRDKPEVPEDEDAQPVSVNVTVVDARKHDSAKS